MSFPLALFAPLNSQEPAFNEFKWDNESNIRRYLQKLSIRFASHPKVYLNAPKPLHTSCRVRR